MNMNRKFGIKLFLGLAFKSLIILFLTSCEEKGQPTPIVRLETNNSSINLSSFVSKVEYISLKTDDRNPIGTIVTIEFFNNLILKVPNKFKGCIQGSAPSSLSCYENTISITQPLSNIIYCYKNGSLESRFEIDFGALACDFDAERDLYTGNPSTFAPYLRTRGYSLPPSRFFEFKNLIYFDFKSVDETYFVFLDKASGVTHIGNELVDDVDHGIFGLPIASWDEKLVTIIEPMDLLDRPILPQGLIGKELDELSNPILALHTLKEAILISNED